jgi:membrane protein YqaA with SNARE-associated domain
LSCFHALITATTSYSIFRFFRRLGALGLLLLSSLDSSFLFLPFGNDLLLIALISSGRSGWTWIWYVVVSTVGSLLGVLVVDVLMRNAGEKGLERFVSARKLEKLKVRMADKGLPILLAAVLPPPFPFTPVIMTAAALQSPRKQLLVMVVAGRLLRYTAEALLALYFGRKVITYLNSKVVVYAIYGLIVVAVVGSILSILKWIGKPSTKRHRRIEHSTSET